MTTTDAAMKARLAFYGDDFTGASDNAAQYARHGLRTLLFFDNPDEHALARAARDYDVIGVAGIARSLSPIAMAEELVPVLRSFQKLGVSFIQYKCCSTFDSSPDTGSLGEAIRLMRAHWPDSLVPVVVATPEFGRYTMFGHHYAKAGERVWRLDRHPVMSRHPVTPMHESDLALILAQQGFTPTARVDLRILDMIKGHPIGLAHAIADEDSIVFDGYTQKQMHNVAASLWMVSGRRTVCALAAQGLAHALGGWLRESGRLDAALPVQALPPVDQLLVLSGSCSALSAAQIDWAIENGFEDIHIDSALLAAEIPLDTPASQESDALQDTEPLPAGLAAIEARMLAALSDGRSVVMYTAMGCHDAELSIAPGELARRIGLLYARLARGAIVQRGLSRLVVAGGDSSSFTMRALGAVALEVCASHFEQNAHVCTVHATDPAIHGVQVLLKGGQVGAHDLYGLMLNGFD